MIEDYGFDAMFSAAFEATAAPGEIPGRVVAATRGHYRVITSDGDVDTTLTGRAAHHGVAPAVGDWVRLGVDLRIVDVLARKSLFSRKAAGSRVEEQVIAANIDVAVIVMALDGDFSLRRLERYLTIAWEAGTRPVVALSKADLVPDRELLLADAMAAAPGVEVIAFSSLTDVDPIRHVFRPRETAVLLGSSGVGKSTLANRLMEREVQATAPVRPTDDKGRHTTTRRELFVLPSGALLLDTPGMRELQLWQGDTDEAFSDVAAIAAGCHFADCRHAREPGCAVRAAVEDGSLPAARLASYHALGRELAHLARQQDPRLLAEHRNRWKSIHKSLKRSYRET